jgi:ABC-type uncharacterized transport system ATPase subunit
VRRRRANSIGRRPRDHWSPAQALARRHRAHPEDRHAVGAIADMSVMENVISEQYRSPRFSRTA